MAHSILLLPGDGIGPEIMGPVGALLERMGTVTGQALTLETALVGGCAIDAEGTPLPCYRSLVPEAPETQEDCATTGIIGALTGVIGSLMAVEVIKEITGAGDSLAGRLLIYDGLSGAMRTVKLNWDPKNPNNGKQD